jgi:hypothetical protein
MDRLLQIDFSQAPIVEKSVVGAFILCLIGAIYWLARILKSERENNRKDTKEITDKNIEMLGELKEVVRNNTEVLNQIKGKL